MANETDAPADDETVLLGLIELVEAKRLRNALAETGVQLELISNPKTCKSGGGCAATVEVYGLARDVAAFKSFLDEERARILEGLGHDAARSNEVFDDQKSQAVCPACGTEFSTQCTECPDCGLGFGAPASDPADCS